VQRQARWTILHADAHDIPLADQTVQCVVTSPPYWGLRDYKLGKRGIGLEPTPDLYVQHIVEIFREVKRVLRDDGTLWLNMGDCYTSMLRSGRDESPGVGAKQEMSKVHTQVKWHAGDGSKFQWQIPAFGTMLKPKDLVGIPWRVAFALQADGWWLRSDIIWSKPNPMPESVTDRPTKAHEYLFLLTKSERYYYDQEAIKEPWSTNTHDKKSIKTPDGWDTTSGKGGHGSFHKDGREKGVSRKSAEPGSGIRMNLSFEAAITDRLEFRNRRTVWEIATQPFPEAHFATFPEALVEPCIKAGSKAGDTVLDPFAGSGTVGVVALKHGRSFVGLDLQPDYCKMAVKRIEDDAPLFNRKL